MALHLSFQVNIKKRVHELYRSAQKLRPIFVYIYNNNHLHKNQGKYRHHKREKQVYNFSDIA